MPGVRDAKLRIVLVAIRLLPSTETPVTVVDCAITGLAIIDTETAAVAITKALVVVTQAVRIGLVNLDKFD